MKVLDHLLRSQCDEHAYSINPDFVKELAPAVKRFRQMKIHLRLSPRPGANSRGLVRKGQNSRRALNGGYWGGSRLAAFSVCHHQRERQNWVACCRSASGDESDKAVLISGAADPTSCLIAIV